MNTAVRRHITAGIALAGASAIAVAPIAPPPPPLPAPHAIEAAKLEVRLAASISNIPPNLINAIANIPYSEVQALNQLADSLFFTGNWFDRAPRTLGNGPGGLGTFTYASQPADSVPHAVQRPRRPTGHDRGGRTPRERGL